jgi:exodeoxyribonuclease III
MKQRLISWNVNGIRAALKKGFLDWLHAESADIICVQETKARPEQVEQRLRNPEGWHASWFSAEKKGYSGVATFSRTAPLSVKTGLGDAKFDCEGRVIESEFPDFTLFNVYFPNGGQGPHRVRYKLEFYDALLKHCSGLRAQGTKVIICGDYNTAHTEIDLARPKENSKTSGFLPEERAWFDRYLAAGYIDCFREFNEEPDWYTWWSFRTRARARNVGWRIDYHLASEDLKMNLNDAFIARDTMGSDHCPVGLELEF